MNDLVIAVPTYNTIEYLKVFLDSYNRYATGYKLVVVCDGSIDGTKEFLEKRKDIVSTIFDKNYGKPRTYNTCLRAAAEECGAKYTLILNDDMVLGPNWDFGLSKWKKDLDNGSLVLLNYVEPFAGSSAGYCFKEAGSFPEDFNMNRWEAFEKTLHSELLACSEEIMEMGPGMPYIISARTAEKYPYDNRFSQPCGCQDGDFLLRLYLNGHKIFRIKKNMVFHFGCGSNKKIRDAGLWVSGGQLFKDKWE